MAKDKTYPGSKDSRVWVLLNTIVEFLEKKRFTPLTAFLFLVIVGIIRSVTESVFFEYPVFSIYLVIQHVAFNFPVLVMGVLIIKLAADVPLNKVYNVIVPGFIFVLLPPFIDYYLLGLGGVEQSTLYAYYAAELTFVEKLPNLNVVNMMLAEEIGPGLKRMVMMILGSSALYIAIKIRIQDVIPLIKNRIWEPIIHKICSLFFGVYGIWVVIWFISSIVPSVFSFKAGGIILLDYFKFNIYSKYYLFMEEYGYTISEILPREGMGMAGWLAQQQRSLFITMFFFILTLSMMLLTLWITHRDLLKNILRTINKSVVFITTGSALLGSAAIHVLDPDFLRGWAIDPAFALHFPYVFYVAVMGFFLGCFASYISEYGKDNPELPKWASKHMSIASLLGGGSFAFLMGPYRSLIIFGIAALLIYIAFYEGNEVLSLVQSALFTLSCGFAFFIGVYTPDVWKLRIMDPYTGRFSTLNLSRNPALDGNVVLLLLALLTAVFVLSFLPKLMEKIQGLSTFPGSMIFVPLFLLPAAVGLGMLAITVVAILGLFVAIIMDDDLGHIPLLFFGISLFVYIIDLWGYIPSIL